jgi:hypothetical protein
MGIRFSGVPPFPVTFYEAFPMTNRQIPARDVARLKQASHVLVQKVGGVKAAADLTQATASRISEACSEHHPTRWLTLVQIADLEAVADDAVVTTALAEISGKQVQGHDPGRPQDMHQHLVHIIIETGDVERLLAAALQDGKLTPHEVRGLRSKIKNAIAGLQALDDDLRRQEAGQTALHPSLSAVK